MKLCRLSSRNGTTENKQEVEDPCLASGSIIGCENQSLSEAISLVGTPYRLHYQSDRSSGNTGASATAIAYADDLGGWTLNVQHRYNSATNTLFLGTGTFRSSASLGKVTASATFDFSIASEDGQLVFEFNPTGLHTKTLNALTGATLYTFNYDKAGWLSSVTDATGNVVTIERDANNSTPTAIVAPFGQRTTLSLDTNGYLAKLTNPAGATYQMSYTTEGLLNTFTDPNSNSSTMTYDALGRLTKDGNAAGGSQSLTKIDSADGYQVTLSTALGRSTTHGVTKLSTGEQQRTSRLPDGTQTSTINATNGTHTTTAPDGTITTVTDGPDPRFSMQAPITSKATVVTGGLTSTLTNARTTTLSNPANLLSLTALTDTVTLNGRTSTSVYDAATQTVTNSSAAGRKAIATIDSLGRVMQAQATGILASNFSYDTRGRLAAISQGAAPNDRNATFSYNPEGYLDTVTDPLGRSAGFGYDAAGRVTRQTLPDGREIAYAYDAKGNLISLTPPGKPGHLFHYTSIDQMAEYKPPQVANAGSTLYDYNLDKDLVKITRPDGQRLDFGYDSAGRLSTLTLPTGQISYAYNATTGKLTGITSPNDGALAYTYNGALLSQTAWTGTVAGTVERTYDNDFRVTSLSVNGENAIDFQYDADSLLTKAGNLTLTRNAQNGLLTGTALGSLTDSYSYDGFPEVTAYEAKYGTSSLLRFEYDYDKLGRIIQKRQIKGGVTHAFDYGYDTAGRLVEVKSDGTSTARYGYDSNGNRTQLNGALVAHYDDQDRLLDYQGATYQYTANGELKQKTVSGQTTQYDYDVLGNLRKATLPSVTVIGYVITVIDYVIDGQNRRIGKKRNGTLEQGFLYQGQLQPIAELDGNGNIKSRFVYATGVNVPDYMINDGVTYRIIKDHLGSPRLVVDIETNTVMQEMDYDAFGNVTLDTNPGFQPFGFAGGLYDRDTKLVRFGARDYEAETGRWMAKDPILFGGGDTNLFGYILDDPLNSRDVFGLSDGGVVITINDPGSRGGATYGGTLTVLYPDGGTLTVNASTWPNPTNPSPGVAPGTFSSTYSPTGHQGTTNGVRVNNGAAVPTNGNLPNPAQDGGTFATGINIHCGSSAYNRGSAGCITVEPMHCSTLWNTIPIGPVTVTINRNGSDGGWW
jgi:RHS repeat-associated protein